MTTEEITQIKIGKHKVGIIGLNQIFKEMSTEYCSMTDEDIKKHLIKRLGKKNYEQ